MSTGLAGVLRSEVLAPSCGWEGTRVPELPVVDGSVSLCLRKSLPQLTVPNLQQKLMDLLCVRSEREGEGRDESPASFYPGTSNFWVGIQVLWSLPNK